MAMLTVYADESGTDGRSPILAVGGYVSEVPLWDDFQNVWNEMRIEKGIDVWHTADLLSGKGDFTPDKGWDAERVADAVQAADDVIEKYALYGVTAYTCLASSVTGRTRVSMKLTPIHKRRVAHAQTSSFAMRNVNMCLRLSTRSCVRLPQTVRPL